jgi:hypothetical protein
LRPAEQDRRVRILKPTEKLRAHDRDWLAAHYTTLTVLYPQYDYGLVMRRDPQFQAVHRRVCVPFMSLGAKLFLSEPDMMLFLNRAAGYPVIASLLQAALSSGDYPHAAVPYADVGDRFGVSRTQPDSSVAVIERVVPIGPLHVRTCLLLCDIAADTGNEEAIRVYTLNLVRLWVLLAANWRRFI